jgi:peptide/nickel transport system permease protein
MRLLVALSLPLALPAVVTGVLWALPGDPAEILCPRQLCAATDALAKKFALDQGPVHYFTTWIANAFRGEFGNSWRVVQGIPVYDLVVEAVPYTAVLLMSALVPSVLGSAATAAGLMPRRLDWVWQAVGLAPAVILALFAAARIEIGFGAQSYTGLPMTLRMAAGALVLVLADGAFAQAVAGTRAIFDEELKQRYVQIAVLRGESVFLNSLPNVLPALMGQLRSRVLHMMSGTVVVEVVLGIPGIGDLLFDGTLLQDFGVVLAATWGFALMSASVLVAHSLVELGHGLWVRRHPSVDDAALQGAR